MDRRTKLRYGPNGWHFTFWVNWGVHIGGRTFDNWDQRIIGPYENGPLAFREMRKMFPPAAQIIDPPFVDARPGVPIIVKNDDPWWKFWRWL